MTVLTTFDSTKASLQDLLGEIRSGKIQLPDFQRGWVWDDEHIRSLLASLTLSYPIGAVMLLETGNPDVRFKPRPVEGVQLTNATEPEKLILDGQQRLTSLFQSLFSGQAVTTRDAYKRIIQRHYYLDIRKALDPNCDREEAIRSVPSDKLLLNFRSEVVQDYSSTEKECLAELLPFPIIFDTPQLTSWQLRYLQVEPEKMHERLLRWNDLVEKILKHVQQYQIPLIVLKKQTPKEAVCQVFEKVNTGGVSLTVFELLTATFASEDFNLRDDWAAREKQLHKYPVLRGIRNTDFLQSVCLLTTFERKKIKADAAISCKRKDILRLSVGEYKRWADTAVQGFLAAAKFLHLQKIFAARDVPYLTQIVPLATILAYLGSTGETDGSRKKIATWYWCGVLGELYGSAIETRFAKDLGEVVAFVQGGEIEPSTIQDASFQPARIYTLRTRNSAAYKGISALLLRDGGLDFRTGEPVDQQIFHEEAIDIHHVFPKAWCTGRKLEPRLYDCIVNKTPLSAKTNRIIGGNAPSVYLEKLQKNAGIAPERLKAILDSHRIPSAELLSDNFRGFFELRMGSLLDRIESAMGKPISRTSGIRDTSTRGDRVDDGDEEDVDTAQEELR